MEIRERVWGVSWVGGCGGEPAIQDQNRKENEGEAGGGDGEVGGEELSSSDHRSSMLGQNHFPSDATA